MSTNIVTFSSDTGGEVSGDMADDVADDTFYITYNFMLTSVDSIIDTLDMLCSNDSLHHNTYKDAFIDISILCIKLFTKSYNKLPFMKSIRLIMEKYSRQDSCVHKIES